MSTLPASGLQPADVLLYRGTGIFGKLIIFWDRSHYSHAGLNLGRLIQGQPAVGEALVKEGIIARGLDVSITDSSEVQARRLKAGLPDPAQVKVLAVANKYLDEHNRYAIENIFMLVILCLVRKIHVNHVLDALLRKIFDSMASLLVDPLHGGKQPMICSEFVFRCYQEPNLGLLDRTRVVPGVEAGSLLDQLLAQGPMPAFVGLGLSRDEARSAMQEPAPGPVDEGQVAVLIQQYLDEAAQPSVKSLALMEEPFTASVEL
ncbi:MAG: hypothetical protein Q7I92_09850, partial [Humidesulfovibrio sp.]|nr:hypothetical protein [Humidesulfovibrio sp.]